MEASALLEDFAPLQGWLWQLNEGQMCGWQALGLAPAATAPAKAEAAQPAPAKKG
jgi:peptidyl-dipeptidase A